MEIKLWKLIRDWLPTAGWQILTVHPPMQDFVATPVQSGFIPGAAFITYADKPKEYELKIPTGERDDMGLINREAFVVIKDDEVLFMVDGTWRLPLKAAEPDFFNQLDAALTTLFKKSEWWQKKEGWSVTGHKEKLWPK